MPPAKLILVALDFSEESHKALDVAVALARGFGARLVLFHAYDLPIGAEYDYSLPAELLPAVRDASVRKLDEVVARAKAEGLEAKGEVAEGRPSEALCEAAERLGADLIVMGTRGRTGLEHVLLGSVAERTLQHAPCPVLTVPRRDAD